MSFASDGEFAYFLKIEIMFTGHIVERCSFSLVSVPCFYLVSGIPKAPSQFETGTFEQYARLEFYMRVKKRDLK